MRSKVIGGILLVTGTTIGAGMLALPIATAQLGFWMSTALLISCWAIMSLCGLLFLEATLWMPHNSNMISMAGATLGKWGQFVAWVAYLVLLYSILSAYIAGGGDLFHYLLNQVHIDLPLPLTSAVFTFAFGFVVFWGIKAVDYVNRGLMLGKMGSLLFLLVLIMPFVSMMKLGDGGFNMTTFPTSLSVTIVAFTSLMIIPSLRTYFNDDVKALRKVILIGTAIPLVCYIGWDAVVMGVVPLHGAEGLANMASSSSSNSDMVAALTGILQKDVITYIVRFFTSICMATSFLSVSLCLSDFLSDGLRVEKVGFGNWFVLAVTFLPPIFIVSFYPDAFIRGLHFAGLACFVLMVLFPPLMVWSGRYAKALTPHGDVEFTVRGGKVLLGMLTLFALFMILLSFKGI